MRYRNVFKALMLFACAVPLLSAPMPVRAEVIGAEQYLRAIDRQDTLDGVNAALAREDVRRALERHGVDPAHAVERVAALNDRELSVLAADLERLPAGGSLLGTVGVVFVVLLILELVGVINIFNKI